MKEDTFIHRYKTLADVLGISVRQLEIEIKVTEGRLSKSILRNSKVTMDIVHRIAKRYPKVNTEWLETGEGPVLLDFTPELNEDEPQYGAEGGSLVNKLYNKWLKIATDITLGKPNTQTLKEMHELVEQLKKQNDELEKEE